jgi:hypothetical protein
MIFQKEFLVEYALGGDRDWVDWFDRQDFRRRFHRPIIDDGDRDGFHGERDDTDGKDDALVYSENSNYDDGWGGPGTRRNMGERFNPSRNVVTKGKIKYDT